MKKKLLHVTFEAFSSTFKTPLINTGTMICAPVPSYSTIVGLISCCLGRPLKKDETNIGFTYSYEGDGYDLERTKRLMFSSGKIKKNPESGIALRQFHSNPKLEVYLDNLALKSCFLNPVGVPTLGRSQDVAWITKVEEIDSELTESGKIKPTLIPYPCQNIGGRVIRYCDYFENEELGFVRTPGKMILYQVVPNSEFGIDIFRNNLYRICENEVIYMHTLESTE
ncbi:MAG: CRISPR-associated protein Cas5 [Methanosarcinales archaeon]|jgi:CRISPR-associated protein Cas5t|nr:CRISPR-associated protein Cas5 [Methanosarcinales archaeon]